MSHATPPLSSTPSSSSTCKYDTHVVKDSTVYENSTTTSTSSFYDDDEDDDEDDDDEEEPFIILQATAMKITSFPPTAVAKIFVKGKEGKGSSIATTTSQKVGGRASAVASRPPAFLATPGDALPVFSSERAKRAARSVR